MAPGSNIPQPGKNHSIDWKPVNERGAYISRGGYIAVAYVTVTNRTKKFFYKILVY